MKITDKRMEKLFEKIVEEPEFRKEFKKGLTNYLKNSRIKFTNEEVERALALASHLSHYPPQPIVRFLRLPPHGQSLPLQVIKVGAVSRAIGELID